jgi:hypothetical protein
MREDNRIEMEVISDLETSKNRLRIKNIIKSEAIRE